MTSTLTTRADTLGEMWSGPNGMLEVFTWCGSSGAPPVAVLPNGYGMLRYAHTVCEVLAGIGASVSAVNFSGQGRSDNTLSLATMTRDCGAFLERIAADSDGQPVTVLAHCTAMLPLIELDRRGFSWSRIKQIVLYGYLANPSDHFGRFLRKGRRYGVRVQQTPKDLPSFPPEDYAKLPYDLIVVHPRIPNNLYRASIDDVLRLVEIAKPRSFYLPDFGYTISDHIQYSKVDQIITSFVAPYLGSRVSANLLRCSLDTATHSG